MKLIRLLPLLLAFVFGLQDAMAQSPTVLVSNQVQTRNGKEYYVHIAQQGQTAFSIARAYGLHYSVAVLKTDIQSMRAGDTVWLPVNDQSRAAVIKVYGSAKSAPKPAEPVQENIKPQKEEAAPAAAPALKETGTKTITVEKGQSVFSIAKKYNTTSERIYQLNPKVKKDGLKAGQKLKVPVMGKESAKAPEKKPAEKKPVEKKPAVPVAKPTTTAPAIQFNPRERISNDKVHISIMMPLRLNEMDKISTTKFDIDQRDINIKTFKSFEYIQFYEGILMAVDDLEKRGISVVLNVVDVPNDADSTVVKAFNSHNVAESDFIICLLTRRPFAKAAELARNNRVCIISPMSNRDEILTNNPYVVKYQPSNASVARNMLKIVSSQFPGSNIYVIHSNNQDENGLLEELQLQANSHGLSLNLFEWSKNAQLATTLRKTRDNVIINIYDHGRKENRVQATTLLNRISGTGNGQNILLSRENYVTDIPDIDYNQLQSVNYTMLNTAYLDVNDPSHKTFIDRFTKRFKTIPQNNLAGMGHDIMLYFATAISQKGIEFWRNPSIAVPQGMLFPMRLSQKDASTGFENQESIFYRLENLRLIKNK
ncbi:MAG: LysM peptidoglycan-binding domain-containing protein [Bacteroidales bacterium]|nr:LysM peptidoglycan-binding domain-containing protein [Bacteroidales bacterium]